jgi:hypothetical protein
MKIHRSLLVLLLLIPVPALARYDIAKVTDWKFHVYICKAATINGEIVSALQAKYGKEAIDRREAELKSELIKSVEENSVGYSFDHADAEFIADLTFSIRKGLLGGGFPYEHKVLLNEGVDLCVHVLEAFDKELQQKSAK